MCKVSNADFDVINIYRSQDANTAIFLNDLKDLVGDNQSRACIITGDFNWNYHQQHRNRAISQIESWNFQQIVTTSTHIEGGLLDHVYFRNFPFRLAATVNFTHFSDHAAISIIPI